MSRRAYFSAARILPDASVVAPPPSSHIRPQSQLFPVEPRLLSPVDTPIISWRLRRASQAASSAIMTSSDVASFRKATRRHSFDFPRPEALCQLSEDPPSCCGASRTQKRCRASSPVEFFSVAMFENMHVTGETFTGKAPASNTEGNRRFSLLATSDGVSTYTQRSVSQRDSFTRC